MISASHLTKSYDILGTDKKIESGFSKTVYMDPEVTETKRLIEFTKEEQELNGSKKGLTLDS